MQINSVVKSKAHAEPELMQFSLTAVAEDAPEFENVLFGPEASLKLATQVGVDAKIPAASVISHRPDVRFPTDEIQLPDCAVMEDAVAQVIVALSTRSTPALFDVTEPTRSGVGRFCDIGTTEMVKRSSLMMVPVTQLKPAVADACLT